MREAHRRAFERAQHQHGVIGRSQLLEIGSTDRSISAALHNGALVVVADGVYRVRGAPQTTAMAMMAATLASRGRASHATAAHLWRLDAPLRIDPIRTTVGSDGAHARSTRIAVAADGRLSFDAITHRTVMFNSPVRYVGGIPTVDATRALIDIAYDVSPRELEAAFERGRKLGLITIESLRQRHQAIGGRGRRGSRKIAALLATTMPNALESKLEVRAWQLLRSAGVPRPERQFWVTGRGGQRYRLDFAWPALMLAFETEGFEWHGGRSQWKRDRARTADLERMGWRIVTADWDDIVVRPVMTSDRVRMALAERRRAA